MVEDTLKRRRARARVKSVDPKEHHLVYGTSIVEFPTDEMRRNVTSIMDRCPHVERIDLLDDDRSAIVTYVVPAEKEGWLRLLEKRPDLIDGKKAKVYVLGEVVHPAHVDVRVPPIVGEVGPCGVGCAKCPFFKVECPGCVFTTLYTGPPNGAYD